jgi:lambda repressor-like predicted transcriptional regulator
VTAIEQRDEVIAEAILSGRSLRSIRKEFSLSTDEIDAVLDRLWITHRPILEDHVQSTGLQSVTEYDDWYKCRQLSN